MTQRWFGAVGVVLALLAAGRATAADPPATLDALVREGLAANREVRGERLALERAQAAVSEAAGLYLPSVTVNARLSDRHGNVTDFGRLINPAFGALNQLTGSAAFPTDIELKLPARQETSLRVTQPLVEPRIAAAWRIRAGQRDAQRGATGAAERRLAADLRTSYLDAAKAVRVTEVWDSTLVLVNEVVRVQESLLAHGAATPDQVLRARADRSDVEQQRLEALRVAAAARQAFNVRMGREVDAPLALLPDSALGLALAVTLDDALASAAGRREELAQARGGVRAARGAVALADAGYLPSLVAAFDWGVQGERYDFSSDQDYTIASLALQWSLFDGGQREARHHQARADLGRARLAQDEAAERVALDVRTAWQAAATGRRALDAAHERLASARRTYELVSRRHVNGGGSLLEVLDARTSFTAARVNDVITTYDYWQRCAELDRAAALYPAVTAASGGAR